MFVYPFFLVYKKGINTHTDTTVHERIEYINARGKLLQFFFEHMYSNNTELFNTKNDAFLNDMERMKYFIDRFNQYYNEETYDFIVSCPLMWMSITRIITQTPLTVHTFMRY